MDLSITRRSGTSGVGRWPLVAQGSARFAREGPLSNNDAGPVRRLVEGVCSVAVACLVQSKKKKTKKKKGISKNAWG